MPRKGENVYKRKDGRWEGRFLVSYTPDGRGKYHSVYAASYTEVKEKLKIYKTNTVKNPFKSSKLAKYCTDWLGMVRLNYKVLKRLDLRNWRSHPCRNRRSCRSIDNEKERLILCYLKTCGRESHSIQTE